MENTYNQLKDLDRPERWTSAIALGNFGVPALSAQGPAG